jgi:serine/threonine protein kinase
MRKFLTLIGLDTIGAYSFVRPLGGGKASVVCLYEGSTGVKQVVKMLIAPRADAELQAFEREVATLEYLNRYDTAHVPKILSKMIQVADYPVYYYIMEYVDGVTLANYIVNNPLPWSTEKALKMIACIAASLSKTSSQGIVHRDLHPGNIILKRNFDSDKQYTQATVDVAIMDYGCHKKAFLNFLDHFPRSGTYEKSNSYDNRNYLRHFGAVSTWSPEFLRDPHSVDVRHDIWALGVLLYRFLTNNYPVRAKSFSDLYERLVVKFDVNWELVKKRNAHWAVGLFLKKLLAPNPRDRCLHDDIAKLCIGLVSKELFRQSDSFIMEFVMSNGDCWICPLCNEMVFPKGGILCTKCGGMIEDSREWTNPFAHI